MSDTDRTQTAMMTTDRSARQGGESSMAQVRHWILAPLFAGLVLLTVPASQVSARWPYLLNSGPLDTSPTAVALDAAGNSYFAGTFSGTINIGGMNFVAAGQRDILVVKLDFDGDLVWARVAGSAGFDDASGLALDATGDVYVTGSLCLTPSPAVATCNAVFGPIGTVAVSGTEENVYVAKLTSAGVWQWVRTASATASGEVRTSDVAVSGSDVFVAGHLRGSLSSTDGGGFSTASRTSRTDAFFAKLSSAGQWSATRTWPTESGGEAVANDNFFAGSLSVQNGQVVAIARTIAEVERPTSASIAHGPVYTLPGGGSCSVEGTPSLNGGATVTCSDINLEAHDNIYFGIKNDTNTNGMSMTGTAPSGNSVFRFLNNSANSLVYESTTAVNNQNGSAAEPVTSRLSLSRVTGSLAVVDSGRLVNNTRGDVGKLFRVGTSSFTIDVDLNATSATRAGLSFANPHVFDSIATPDSGATRLSLSGVDLAFYYTDSSRLVFLASSDLSIESAGGFDLGFVADAFAGNGDTGLAVSGYLHAGRMLTVGNSLAGPGVAVARYERPDDTGPLSGVWISKADGTAFAGRLAFGPAADTLYATAGYRGEIFFTPSADPLNTLQIGPVNPDAPGTDDDALVAALDDSTGEWVWATRVGGTGTDRATGIAIDSATPDPNVVVVGTYVAPAAFGNFDYDGGCENECLVRVGTDVVLQSCNPLNEEALCVLGPCPISSLCLAGVNPPSSTSFAGKLVDEGEEGDWLQPVERWVVGEEVPRPEGAQNQQPAIMVEGTTQGQTFFYWSAHEKKLFAVRPTELKATVSWSKSGGQAGNIVVEGVVRWPDDPQVHMATAPVDVELRGNRCPAASSRPFAACTNNADCAGQVCGPLNAASTWTFGGLLYRSGESDAAVDANKVFTASAGRAVLLMVNGPTQSAENANVAIVVVRTLDPQSVVSGQESCAIGAALVNDDHKDPNGKNGWVVNAKSFYDGVGADAAYTRDPSRSGSIIPVNLQRDAVDDDEMLVVWYRQDERGVAWPQRTILYDCQWPEDPDSIVVISGLGSDGRCEDERAACQSDDDCGSGACIVQPPLSPQQFPSARIYNQPDPNLAGFNPNEEHALLLPSNAGTGSNAVFALRTDLNTTLGLSEPYVLLKHRDPTTQQWRMRVYGVSVSDSVYQATFSKRAGSRIDAPYPLTLFAPCSESCAPLATDCAASGSECIDNVCVGGSLAGDACAAAADCLPSCLEDGAQDSLCSGAANLALFKDHLAIGDDGTWKGWWARSPGTVTVRQHYPIQTGFFTDFDLDGGPELDVGACEPWLVSDGEQETITYSLAWPEDVPILRIGETLLEPKGGTGLPSISSQAAVEVVFETTSQSATPPNEEAELVRLIDPLSSRSVPLAALPTDIVSTQIGPRSRVTGGQNGDVKLSPGVSARITHDNNAGVLSYTGVFDETGLGEPLLMLNVMTDRERAELKNLSTNTQWDDAVDALYHLSRNPNGVDADGDDEPDEALLVGLTMQGSQVVREKLLGDKALTAGLAADTGYVTLAFNNDPTLAPLPISLEVIKIDCAPYQGQIQVIPSSNVFDEQVTVRHSGDFAGDPGALEFEWYYALKEQDCQSIPVPQYPEPVGAPWIPAPNGSGPGIVDVTLSGPGVTSLADTCFIARYKGYPICGNDTVPSQWAGAPLGPTSPTDPRAQLVPGWLTRVTEGLNPFDQRTADFRNNEVETLANLLVSAGERFEGPVAFNPDADAINGVGLIEIYQSVLRRGEDLSINEGISVGAVNSKLLDVAARISDLYMALGNEAFGDALDPTIGFDTSGEFGTAAPSIFAFQNQTDSLLTEELALLRGRDDSAGASPVYNRLIWNFTNGDGQVAYQQNYNISNQDEDADIDEFDARILFPQGHGDAWGHYLTALKGYYMLLRHPNYVWLPRSDSVLVAGSEVLVDFTDERRFATSAAARARTGAQIVDLTYRQRWVDDPAGQWQGYKDTVGDRAFGVSDWAQRAGQGALFDWVVANAILPPQSDAPPGIQKIDRTTVPELREIAAQSSQVQAQLDLVDGGVNPLGVAKNAVPFDIDPTFLQVSSSEQGLSHYEQIADRAGAAMANAVRVFNHANGLTELLRRTQDTAVEFARNIAAEERDYNNRLIEIFGSPYPEDIGPGRTYKAGYQGPDVWNWDLAEPSEITGLFPEALADVSEYTLAVRSPDWDDCSSNEGTCRYDNSGKLKYDENGKLLTIDTSVDVRLSNRGFGKVKNPAWSIRESPGELQLAQSELLQARASFEQAVEAYSKLILDIECVISTIQGQNQLAEDRLVILNRVTNTKLTFNALIFAAKGIELGLKRTSETIKSFAEVGKDALPKVVGLATDAFSGVRSALEGVSVGATLPLGIGADAAELSQLAFAQATDIEAQVDGLAVQGLEDDFQIFNLLGELGQKTREEPVRRIEALGLAEKVRQSEARLRAVLARGVRLIDELEAFRKRTATNVADSRYSDMAFRIFRNDALQKYRAQLDLAARYVYLSAAAYDYETNLSGTDARAGRRFLTDIVRQRSLGQFVDGEPVAGSPGLGNVLAQMNANFSVLKGQLGFNNPQNETNRFSLRRELFRILDDSNDTWRSALARHRVEDLWQLEEFRRFARPPRAEADGPLAGIVIPIPTNVTFGLNFFGWPLAGGDSAYDPTNFATKVRTMGVWFGNYNAQGLSNTPRVYLIPAGDDVLRTPTAGDLRTRNWTVLDQRIPVPFPIGQTALDDPAWSPQLDSLSEPLGGVRQFSSFRAFHDSGSFSTNQVTTDSRAIGRSVWNTRWLLIVTGGTLLADAEEGLDTFIYGRPAPSGTVIDPDGVKRDGSGISDVLLFFQTYALSGN